MSEKKCTWKFDKWDDYYETSRGNAFCFSDDKGLDCREPVFLFCPYCGLRILEVQDD